MGIGIGRGTKEMDMANSEKCPVCDWQIKDGGILSLIHISEPTRPY